MNELAAVLSTTNAFPVKLFHIVNFTSQSSELSKVLSWDDTGTILALHDIEKFQELILSKYFKSK